MLSRSFIAGEFQNPFLHKMTWEMHCGVNHGFSFYIDLKTLISNGQINLKTLVPEYIYLKLNMHQRLDTS